jgi:hypothetical protein
MKDSRPKIDELMIDELVSGQLTGDRYRAVLRALDAEPAKWRDCALAFLEEQALRTELRALAQGTIDWSGETTAESYEKSRGESVSAVEVKTQPDLTSKPISVPPAGQVHSSLKSLLSMAALILVSFTVGWLGSEVVAERQLTVDAGANSLVQTPTRSPSEVNSVTRPKMDTQFVVDHPGALDHGIPSPIRELERNGRISVKTFDMLVPATLHDGTPALVPVQEMVLSRGRIESY